jgi:hypothetical protein
MVLRGTDMLLKVTDMVWVLGVGVGVGVDVGVYVQSSWCERVCQTRNTTALTRKRWSRVTERNGYGARE